MKKSLKFAPIGDVHFEFEHPSADDSRSLFVSLNKGDDIKIESAFWNISGLQVHLTIIFKGPFGGASVTIRNPIERYIKPDELPPIYWVNS